MKNRKIFVIGLDGATWDLIKPWADAGKLPTFKHMMENGGWGILKSTIPAVTPPAWTSIITGKNPGKHGIYDFYTISRPDSDDFKINVINSTLIKSRRIWNVLNDHGIKTVVVNVPISYPPDKVDGAFISGMLTPGLDSHFTYPEELRELVINLGIGIESSAEEGVFEVMLSVLSGNEQNIKKFVDGYIKQLIIKYNISEKLLKKCDANFLFLVFEGTDRLQHYLWSDRTLKYIEQYYKEIDNILARTLNSCSEEDVIAIVSDHGFSKIKKIFYINNFLFEIGLLAPKKACDIFDMVQSLIFPYTKKLIYILSRFGVKTDKLLKKKISKRNIDIKRSSAYCLTSTSMGIFVKKDENYEENRFRIIEKLNAIIDKETGKNIIKAYKKEEVCKGENCLPFPDVFIDVEKGYLMSEMFISCRKLEKSNWLIDVKKSLTARNGDHSIDGIYLFYSKNGGLNKGKCEDANVVDITPTILYQYGIPIPVDIDGKVIEHIFNEDYLSKNKIEYSSNLTYKEAQKIKDLRQKIKTMNKKI